MRPEDYKDVLGTQINVGDTIVYTTTDGRIQFGRVLELREMKGWNYSTSSMGKVPSLKIQGSRRRGWGSDQSFKKIGKPSFLYKLDNILVINQHLPVMMTLV